jgi:hypothetical protein
MTYHTLTKQERIIEAIRHGLEGPAAIDFIRQSGYAMTMTGLARHLHKMGGRGRIQELLNDGKTTIEILAGCFPEADLSHFRPEPPSQPELFSEAAPRERRAAFPGTDVPLYDTTKLSLRIPADLYEAIRLAARAERKSQNQLIVDILTSALSRMPDQMTLESYNVHQDK